MENKEYVTYSLEIRHKETDPKMKQMLELADKDFKRVIITVFNNVKKNNTIIKKSQRRTR